MKFVIPKSIVGRNVQGFWNVIELLSYSSYTHNLGKSSEELEDGYWANTWIDEKFVIDKRQIQTKCIELEVQINDSSMAAVAAIAF